MIKIGTAQRSSLSVELGKIKYMQIYELKEELSDLEYNREAAMEAALEVYPNSDEDSDEVWDWIYDNFSDFDEDRYNELIKLKDELGQMWDDEAPIIPEREFVGHIEEMVKECYLEGQELPHFLKIDWETTANHCRADYYEFEFDGEDYLIQCY